MKLEHKFEIAARMLPESFDLFYRIGEDASRGLGKIVC